jgi:hypothetical protein
MDAPGPRYRDREESRFYQAGGHSPEQTSLKLDVSIDAQVQVTVLHSDNGTTAITVPDEPITFGPRLTVPSRLLI